MYSPGHSCSEHPQVNKVVSKWFVKSFSTHKVNCGNIFVSEKLFGAFAKAPQNACVSFSYSKFKISVSCQITTSLVLNNQALRDIVVDFILSRLPQAWHDIGIWFSLRPFIHTSVNICDHPSVNTAVQVRNSETL